jgi:GntR family transcriptional regulator
MAVIALDPRDRTPIYAQLERGFRAAIASGRLRHGEQLPTVRQLAVDLQINANTVARVYSDLERAGVLETRRGVGTFVRATPAEARSTDEHQRRLKAFVIHLISNGAAAGFTLDEIDEELQTHRQKERSI